jgi:hypothetical protein
LRKPLVPAMMEWKKKVLSKDRITSHFLSALALALEEAVSQFPFPTCDKTILVPNKDFFFPFISHSSFLEAWASVYLPSLSLGSE